MKLIICGTGRCGTGYVSKVITALGMPCGHELVFTAYGIANSVVVQPEGADASWMAVPYLNQYPDAVKIHLMRNPLSVVNSLFHTPGLFGDLNAYGRFLHTNCALDTLPDKRDQVLEFWLQWNERCAEVCNHMWRVEEISYSELVTFLFGLGIDPGNQEGFDTVSTTYNSRPKSPVSWSGCSRWPEFLSVVKDYGYAQDTTF